MQTIKLCFRGSITAKIVKSSSELPTKATLFDCDNLETSNGLIGDSVNIYIYSTPKKGTKYFVKVNNNNYSNEDYYPSHSDVYGF
jgi:hypothetical protein